MYIYDIEIHYPLGWLDPAMCQTQAPVWHSLDAAQLSIGLSAAYSKKSGDQWQLLVVTMTKIYMTEQVVTVFTS